MIWSVGRQLFHRSEVFLKVRIIFIWNRLSQQNHCVCSVHQKPHNVSLCNIEGVYFVFVLIFSFFFFRGAEKHTEQQRPSFHLLVPSSNTYNRWDWAKAEARSQEITLGIPTWETENPTTGTNITASQACWSQSQSWKMNSHPWMWNVDLLSAGLTEQQLPGARWPGVGWFVIASLCRCRVCQVSLPHSYGFFFCNEKVL